MKRIAALAVALLIAVVIGAGLNAEAIRRSLVFWADDGYAAEVGQLTPSFEGADAERPRLDIALDVIATDLKRPTDLVFTPAQPTVALIVEQDGRALWLDLATGERGTFWQTEVVSKSELGLLGAAFDPKDPTKLYIYRTVQAKGAAGRSEVVRLVLSGDDVRSANVESENVMLVLDQPYGNHNAGQIAFGPDGMLYVGFGDGGFRNDPHEHGQNRMTWLGAMLRIDVSGPHYRVPDDNPFVNQADARPEIWAWGLRNPWRFHFDPKGRLIVADVGQNAVEEVDIVERGDNLGWRVREGAHCFDGAGCETAGHVDPIWEYGHEEGSSVTGGVVVTAEGSLRGQYVLGDFTSGRLWALELPADKTGTARASALGKYPILPVAFARDAEGRAYVLDYGQGRLLRIEPAKDAP